MNNPQQLAAVSHPWEVIRQADIVQAQGNCNLEFHQVVGRLLQLTNGGNRIRSSLNM